MAGEHKMKQPKHHTSIFILLIFITVIISCNTSTDSNDIQGITTNTDNVEVAIEDIVSILKDTISEEVEYSIPKGYKLYGKVQGDLNGDDLDDHVLIVKATKTEDIVINRFDEEVDRNRRGVLVYLSEGVKSNLAIENVHCFSSENEDGGVYFAPELSLSIRNGKLYVEYAHGRYGYWAYTFRYQNDDFELIGYDSSSNRGPIINTETSINFLTKRKLIRKNINEDIEESGDEIFEDTWEDVDIQELYKLSEIKNFDELYL